MILLWNLRLKWSENKWPLYFADFFNSKNKLNHVLFWLPLLIMNYFATKHSDVTKSNQALDFTFIFWVLYIMKK